MLKYWTLIGGLALVCGLWASAQSTPPGKGAAALAQAASEGKITFLVFHRAWDAAAQAAAQAVQTQADKHTAKASWAAVNVGEAAEKALVDQFQLSRAPLPLVLAVHPNGAVIGFFQKPMTEADFVECLVSPTKAECMKQLQQNRLVLLCVQPAAVPGVPAGVQEFHADPEFAKRSQVLTVRLDDPNEASFFTYLQVDPQTAAPTTVFMAPPGVLVGKFPATATKADLAKALHKAGKCCDNKDCKHNH